MSNLPVNTESNAAENKLNNVSGGTHAPKKLEKLVAVKGMNDILPPESAQWEAFEAKVRDIMGQFAYQNVRTPIVEPTGLFVRGLGEATDVVEKEMYSFVDKLNGDNLTLRPENTASLVRAAVEHSLIRDGGKRLFYMGPMFRHEKPQRGRYRQFHQVGAEALGFPGYEVDAELIILAYSLWKKLGLTNVRLELNCLGEPHERQQHRQALVEYFQNNQDLLDEDSKRRLISNPLRILDTKNSAMQELVNNAPSLLDFLGEASKAHFEGVKQILNAHQIDFTINHRLVRGLDYYNLTVFEFITEHLGSQGTICGGGRYDYLFEEIGGKAAPAIGWALGVERILELLKVQELQAQVATPDFFAVLGELTLLPKAMLAITQLRQSGFKVQMFARPNGANKAEMSQIKAQFKKADASGALYALVFAGDEMTKNCVSVKNLRDRDAQQLELPIADLVSWAQSHIHN